MTRCVTMLPACVAMGNSGPVCVCVSVCVCVIQTIVAPSTLRCVLEEATHLRSPPRPPLPPPHSDVF